MRSRNEILHSIRKFLPQSSELPELNGTWVQYPDLTSQFIQTLEFVGGECQLIDSVAEIPAILGEIAGPGKVIVSGLPEIAGTLNLADVKDPHELAPVDLAIFPGELAVAENAGIWVSNVKVAHRAIYFITQHLVLVIRQQDLVPHLHAAYERIDVTASSLGCFISGPSKTADIEQSLVKGAHGARTLKVFMIRDQSA